MPQTPRHKVFISFHHDDQRYKDRFVRMMKGNVVNKSVEDRDIDDQNIKTATIRQKIRDKFIADATVTVVLIGRCTWQRKHVDWEIGSSLRKTQKNPRCGLLGILLPDHPDFEKQKRNLRLIPPRLADNCDGDNSYACLYDWESQAINIRKWIHQVFKRRDGPPPNNSREQFGSNRRGKCLAGWQN